MPTYPFRFSISRADAPNALAQALLEAGAGKRLEIEIERKVIDFKTIDTRDEYGTERTICYTAAGAQVLIYTWENQNQGTQQVLCVEVVAPHWQLKPEPQDATCYTLEASAECAERVFSALFPRFGHDNNPQMRHPYLLAGTDPHLILYRMGNLAPTPEGAAAALELCSQYRAQMPEYTVALLKVTAHQCRMAHPALQIRLLEEALALDTAQNGPDAAPGYWATLIRAEAENGNLAEANRRAAQYLATALPAHRPVCGEVCRLMGELTARFAPANPEAAQSWYRRGAQEFNNETCRNKVQNLD